MSEKSILLWSFQFFFKNDSVLKEGCVARIHPNMGFLFLIKKISVFKEVCVRKIHFVMVISVFAKKRHNF